MPEDGHRASFEEAWGVAVGELRRSLPQATFDLWIAPLEAAGEQAGTLYVKGPARVRTWVERRYLPALESALSRAAPELMRISLVDESEPGSKTKEDSKRVAAPVPLAADQDFDSFVIGPGNRFAHAAALAVAEAPGEAYNPLFLHGPPGLGKTHLMGAIVSYMRENHRELTVHYTTAERFTSEFVTALRTEGPDRFKQRYRELDALLIDDVQVLEGKPRTEEEFVNTFNALFAAGKQIVLSSDRPPGSLSKLEERLRDRLDWGLTAELEAPDLRTRVALLWQFAEEGAEGSRDPRILREIASKVPGNVRRLEGALTRVLALSSILDEPLDSNVIDRALAKPAEALAAARGGSITAPTVSAIQDMAASVVGVPKADLLSTKRDPTVVRARHLAIFLARELTPLSLAQIAREFGRDHSTVIHAVRSVQSKNEPGSPVAADIHRVRTALGEREPDTPTDHSQTPED